MPVYRRRRGFERAGAFPADQLGLPRARGRDLVLSAAWRVVAGGAIARRARVAGVRRGVLEIEVEDERWLETLRPLVPGLAGRLAALRPELGVRRLRLRRRDRERPERSVPLDAGGDASAEDGRDATAFPPRRAGEDDGRPTGSWIDRLEEASDRCLRRRERHLPPPGSRRP